MRHSLVATACALLVVLATAGLARADSQHFAPTKIKATKKGCSITFCMRSDGYKNHARPTVGQPGSYGPYTYLAGSVSAAYVKKAFPSVAVPPRGTLEHTIELDYDAHGITAGQTYDLTTVWNTSAVADGAAGQHVWGMTRSGVSPITFVAPQRLGANAKTAD